MLLILLPGAASAQTMRWVVRPSSAQIEDYGKLLKVRKDGKSGLIDHRGREVLAIAYDSITSFSGGYALAMNYRGRELKIEGVIAEGDTEMQPLTEDVYATQFSWFSDNLMPVKSSSGWGYMDSGGNITIPCQFEEAYPFSEGWASVKIDDRAYYIDRSMNYLSVEVGEGNLAFASTFLDGEAVVYSRFMKGYIINRQGRKVRNYPVRADKVEVNAYDYSVGDKAQGLQKQTKTQPIDERFVVFSENGRFGYKSDGKVILPAQFDSAEPVRGGYASVRLKGQNGILQVVEGDIATAVHNPVVEVVDGRVSGGELLLSLPEAFGESSMRMHMTDAEGHHFTVTTVQPNGQKRTFTFTPDDVPIESGSVKCDLEVWSDNLLLSKQPYEISYNVIKSPSGIAQQPRVKKPAKPSLTKIWPRGKRANPNNEFFVAVNVSNSGDERGDVQVMLSVNGKSAGTKHVSVRAHGQSQAIFTVPNVKKPFIGKVSVKIVGGTDKMDTSISFEPFY